MCMYGIALWKNYTAQVMNRMESCYNKCLKIFFCYPKFSSVTDMLFELKLPTFNILLHNHGKGSLMQCMYCNNFLFNRIIQVLWPCFVVGALIDIFIVFYAYILYSLVFYIYYIYFYIKHTIMYSNSSQVHLWFIYFGLSSSFYCHYVYIL